MNSSKNKEWFTAFELEDVGGLPKGASNITRKAKTENWQKRQIKGKRGVAYEYHYTSFPLVVQQALGFTPSTEQDQPNETEKNVNFQQEDETYDDIVDYRDVRISAGFGYENDEPTELNTIKVERAWFLRNRLNAKNCAMFKVSGDSMYPTLDDNEEIIVDCSKKDLTEGKIFIINHSGTMWVKRIKRNFDSIELISDNNFYDPIKLNEEESNQLNIIGQVVRGYRDF
ncbi:helix-turn-helix domain-containing protein [Lonepinella sp. BR2474]|uniref:helix-turn-helix domain-containing protein n=1 Tax=Lonepinella sp. BR2474 TaxID=3434548 RepID=UPI003F6DD0A8